MTRFFNERVLVGVVLFLAPLILMAITLGDEFTDVGQAFSPMFFPVTMLWFWAGVAGISLVRDLWRAGAGPDAIKREVWGQIVLVAVAMGAFVFALTRLGFLLSAIGFAFAVLIVLGIRTLPILVVFSVVMPLAIFMLFHHGLGLPLPTSPFSYRF